MLGDHQGRPEASARGGGVMQIAYLCADRGVPVLGDKGASVHTREFVSALARLGHEVTVFCARQGAGNPPPPGARLIEIAPDESADEIETQAALLGLDGHKRDRVLNRELGKLAYDRKLPTRVLAALDRAAVHPDILYERYALFHRAGGSVAKTLGIPHLLEVNAPLAEEQERFRDLRLKIQAQTTETEILSGCDHIIAVSEAIRAHALTAGAEPERVTVVPNGVDIERFQGETNAQGVRARYGLAGRSVIGFVGSLKPWHGLDFLLDAFDDIRAARPDAALLVVGDGPERERLADRVAQANLSRHVIFTGRVAHHEVPDYMAAMDITVAPYMPHEGFYFSPLKVVESMAAGRPVVAPRLGQLTELVADGTTGILYPPGDLRAFVSAVVGLLMYPQRRLAMAEAASVGARELGGWMRAARQVIAIAQALRIAESCR